MGALLVFCLAFGAYAWTASPVAGWLDSAELVAAAASLGVAHSPGHPLPALAGRAAALLPAGDVVLRVNLASALAAAAAAALLHVATAELLARVAPRLAARARAVIAAAAALAFAASWAAWTQAVRAEVYALEAALLFAALVFVLRFDGRGDRRALAAAGLACGLALANHHFVTLLFLFPAGAVALAARPGARAAARTALLGLLGLAAFAYLPLRAARHPVVDWGDPHTASRFAWTVSAQAFQKSLAPEARESRATEAVQVTGALLEQATPAAGAAALFALVVLLRRRGARRAALLLGGLVLCGAAGPAVLGFDPENPDAYGYLLPALGALFVLAAAGVAVLAEAGAPHAPRAVPAAACLLAAALVPVQAAAHAGDATLRDAHAAERYARAVLDPLPPRTLLVTSYYETAFQLWALQAVEGARPDVAHLDRSFLGYPGFAELARARHPELAPLIDAPLKAGEPTPVVLLAELARRRPVAVELHLNLDGAVYPLLAPDGFVAWLFPGPPPAELRARVERDDAARAAAATLALCDPRPAPGGAHPVRCAATVPAEEAGALRVLTWGAYQRARAYCALRRWDAAAGALADARRVDPHDATLDELEAACKP